MIWQILKKRTLRFKSILTMNLQKSILSLISEFYDILVNHFLRLNHKYLRNVLQD